MKNVACVIGILLIVHNPRTFVHHRCLTCDRLEVLFDLGNIVKFEESVFSALSKCFSLCHIHGLAHLLSHFIALFLISWNILWLTWPKFVILENTSSLSPLLGLSGLHINHFIWWLLSSEVFVKSAHKMVVLDALPRPHHVASHGYQHADQSSLQWHGLWCN